MIPCASCPISSDDLTLTLLVRSPLLSLISALISLSSLLVFTIGFTTFLVLIRNATMSAPIANTRQTPPVVFANAANACICLIARSAASTSLLVISSSADSRLLHTSIRLLLASFDALTV